MAVETPAKLTKPERATPAVVENYLAVGPASGWQLRADKNYPPYVLIIDEINRGNISRIFGELITLIEDDKRNGESNALVATLPCSQEAFTVPPNLYLLGTMNTADKSLALLDVALRRRFEFNELAPNFSVCEGLPDEMREVMEIMNHRLEIRKDRDHRIGHAFFIGVTDAAGFTRVFRRKVVPLLQEYFFNDIDGARYVLGEEENEDAKGFLRPLDGHSRYQRNRWRWFTDEEPEMDCWSKLSETLGGADA
jgi:5-methylcytosine-specific restriction protein B